MKGIIFREFMELVEEKFGLEILDTIIEESNLESGGAYTSVGTYSHFEIVELVTNLSKKVNISITELLFLYGNHFFNVAVDSYPVFFKDQNDAFDFLESLDNYIHPEVLKLYPDAELPRFESIREKNMLTLTYYSERKMSDFAHGLISATINHFDENIIISKTNIKDDQSEVQFTLTHQ